jgi:cytoskeletal protein CcmA (bactofilin family)
VRATERIELQPKAEITGDVYYKVIEMALGAAINGNLVRESLETGRDNKGTITRLKAANEGAPESED